MDVVTNEAPADAVRASEADTIRSRAREEIGRDFGGVAARAARDADIKESTFSAWLNGTYQGDNERVAHDVGRWLGARAERRQAMGMAPAAPGFQETPTAQRILQICMQAQVMCDFAVIAGVAGIGKTTALRHYVERTPNAWMATMEPLLRSPHALLDELARHLGVAEKASARLSGAIQQRLRDRQGLLIIDEAHQLSTEAIDQLRSLHDKAAVGIVMSGNIETGTRLEGAGRNPQFAPLWSRVGVRKTWAKPLAGDVQALLDAWGFAGRAEREFLGQVAMKGGALRSIVKCARLAGIYAMGAGEEVSVKHLKAAYAQLVNGGAHE